MSVELVRKGVLTLVLLGILTGLALRIVVSGPVHEMAFVVAIVGFPVVGYLILLNRSLNGVGLFLFATGLLMTADIVVEQWKPSLGDIGILLDRAPLFEAGFATLVLAVVVFPSGRPSTRFDRYYLRVVSVVIAASLTLMTVAPEMGESPTNQIELLGVWVRDDGFFIVPLMALIGIVSAIVRGIRSVGVERLQYKWFVSGATVFAAALVVLDFPVADVPWVVVPILLGLQALPAAILVAVLRYRLYDINRVISRTVTYALVIGLLTLGVALVATLTASQFKDPRMVAATTLAVAALFNPLRKRVQVWADRRFNRSRYDAQQVMDEFAGTLRDRVRPEGVVDGWVGVVRETMQPGGVGVWMRQDRN